MDPKAQAKQLFFGWNAPMVQSCLEGIMGTIDVAEKTMEAGAAALGDFCFLAGKPEEAFFGRVWESRPKTMILVPQNAFWESFLDDFFQRDSIQEKDTGLSVKKITRYAMGQDQNQFDEKRLSGLSHALPAGCELRPIEEEIYALCWQEEWSRDLVSQFQTYDGYKSMGLGVAAFQDGRLVAGASSYCRYRDGIEIEVDTKEGFRRKGLAAACSAKLILRCLKRGLYPHWDAHTEISRRLAEKLGYHLEYAYPAYEITDGSR